MFFLLWSCDTRPDKKNIESDNHQIPKKFIAGNSEKIRVASDTVYVKNQLFSGFIYFQNSTNSDTVILSGYKNGLLEGITKKWYSKNKLMEERYYSKGAKNGKQLAFWENGKKRFEFIAKNDVYEGELKEWDVKGSLIHWANFKNGQEEGSQKMWYDNGKIKANYVIRNGKRYGLLGTKNCINVSDSIFVIR
jgi:antitoxin component YwqK of YwqJK toxin-antitoxin module